MSGIEIAGIVLAVIPLFIAAAEHLQSDTSSKKAIKDGYFAGTYRLKLTQQQTLLGLYVKGIVGRTSLPSRVQAELVDDLGGAIWERADVIEAIGNELGDARQPFLDLLKQVCSALALSCKAETKRADDDVVRSRRGLDLLCPFP